MSHQSEKYSNVRLDDIDLKILGILQNNARITVKELASQVHLSATACFERWRRLERFGFIERYVSVLSAEKLYGGLTAICAVKLLQPSMQHIKEFNDTVRLIPEVQECYQTSGQYDYLLKIYATDMRQYRDLLVNRLGTIGAIGTIDSSFVMDTVKDAIDIPAAHA